MSEGEVNILVFLLVTITQISPRKLKKTAAVTGFHCLVSKSLKKKIYVVIRRKKRRLVCVVSSGQKINRNIFIQVLN